MVALSICLRRQVFGSEPTPGKSRAAKPNDKIGASTADKNPNEAGTVVLEHQQHRPLVNPQVDGDTHRREEPDLSAMVALNVALKP